MARRRDDPKEAALREARCLNPRPQAVADQAFTAGPEFFDARDLVQVKYEMVRRVRAEGQPVSRAAAAFGFSRPSYYQAAAAVDAGGLAGLVRPGPAPGGRTSSPRKWSPSPPGPGTPTRRCAARTWPTRSRTGSGSPCTRARWNGRWPARP